jgi:hypothetical protein
VGECVATYLKSILWAGNPAKAPTSLLTQSNSLPLTAIDAGGLPSKVGDEVIGAIGVSGSRGGENDEACAKAAIDKVEDARIFDFFDGRAYNFLCVRACVRKSLLLILGARLQETIKKRRPPAQKCSRLLQQGGACRVTY